MSLRLPKQVDICPFNTSLTPLYLPFECRAKVVLPDLQSGSTEYQDL